MIPPRIKQLFDEVVLKAFATVNSEGLPNVVVIGSSYIEGNKIIIADTFFDKTKKNIEENSNVAVSFWEKSEGYQLKGKAKYYSSGNIVTKTRKWIKNNRSKKKYPIKGVVEIEVTEIYALTSHPDHAGERII